MPRDRFESAGFLGSDAFDRDVILVGTVTVRVVSRRTGAPVVGARVTLAACGFT